MTDEYERLKWTGIYLTLFLSDYVCHWFQCNAKYELIDFEGKVGSHKSGRSPLIKFFYTHPILLWVCILTEVFSFAQYV